MLTPNVVLLGGPNSGKTHYAGQLYGRFKRNPGVLQLRSDAGIPSDLSLFEEVLRCLENGNAASHTPTETWDEIRLPLIDNSQNAFDLLWPDYGGEQLKKVFEDRSVNQTWQGQLAGATGWLLMIRLNSEVVYNDALEKLSTNHEKGSTQGERSARWDANAYWVEKLQILLHVAKLGTMRPLENPRLAVLLSCYDEISDTSGTPMEVLNERLPFLASFIRNNWMHEQCSVWGLSALGQELTPSSNVDKFMDEGPEFQGWVVSPNGGDRNMDICLPIQWLVNGNLR